MKVVDIPDLFPPNSELPIASSPLTKENEFLLLGWIKNLLGRNAGLHERFVRSIKEGCWLKTSSGYKSPSKSLLLNLNDVSTLQLINVPFDLPLIDEKFYDNQINWYKDVFEFLGVTFERNQAFRFTTDQLHLLGTSSSLNRDQAISLLECIRNLGEQYLFPKELVEGASRGIWLKTSKGFDSPLLSVLLDPEWEDVLQFTDLPLIDEAYYGEFNKQQCFLDLGMCSSFEVIFSSKVKDRDSRARMVKTNLGYKATNKSFLYENKWGKVLEIVGVPLIDESFYGNRIRAYKNELSVLGVTFTFEGACRELGSHLRSLLSSSKMTKDFTFAVLDCCKNLRTVDESLLKEFKKCIFQFKWLKTKHGYRASPDSILLDSEWEHLAPITNLPFIDDSYYGESIHSYKEELRLVGVVSSLSEGYHNTFKNLRWPEDPIKVSPASIISLLKCIKHKKSANPGQSLPKEFLNIIKWKKWVKTSMGYRNPSECLLCDTELACILEIVQVALVDEDFYGAQIQSYKEELKQVGVITNFEDACNLVTNRLRVLMASSGLSKDNALSVLDCCKSMRRRDLTLPSAFRNFIFKEKWLETIRGYRSPRDSIMFASERSFTSEISDLPFVDESYYGKDIYSYKYELRYSGVVIDLNQGFKFVVEGFKMPKEPSKITASQAISVLKFIRHLNSGPHDYSLPKDFVPRIKAVRWVKTRMATSAKVEVRDGCSLVASHLYSHTQFPSIARVVNYLNSFKWKPEDTFPRLKWVPCGNETAEWVNSENCLLYDGDFESSFHVLERFYEQNLFSFLSNAFGVQPHPKTEDYCRLWKDWGDQNYQVTYDECCSFWAHILNNWDDETKLLITSQKLKIPTNRASSEISLVSRHEVFIPDDLQLSDMFQKASENPFLFVQRLGVSGYGERELQKMDSEHWLISKGLVRLVLGYLANPMFAFLPKQRHQMARVLLGLAVLETQKPIEVGYCLILTRKCLTARERMMVRWDRESSRLLLQRQKTSKPRANIEFIASFAQAISEGLLWENSGLVDGLRELIELGFLLNFEVDSVNFLLQRKNLLLFVEDEMYLSQELAPES
ncbi:hypothetical protein AMTR_s00016p00192530 [Amborella trichopoda]|uniref:Uncharacterized protein n=1 Tax=Amborella trichopoda TaxID=13333 RepID=W1P8Q0_AMBTC|nr:hypothetical protein AMTR_s00016p00192530 [Amborella trichopoda]